LSCALHKTGLDFSRSTCYHGHKKGIQGRTNSKCE
jgi:hypothetical protein